MIGGIPADRIAEHRLVWREGDSGQCHFLLGREVTCGSVLDVLFGGKWERVRYEFESRDGEQSVVLYSDLGRLPDSAAAELFRWPDTRKASGGAQHRAAG